MTSPDEFKRELGELLDRYSATISYEGKLVDSGIGEYESPTIVIADDQGNTLISVESYSLTARDLQ